MISVNMLPRAAHYMSKSRMWYASRGMPTTGNLKLPCRIGSWKKKKGENYRRERKL